MTAKKGRSARRSSASHSRASEADDASAAKPDAKELHRLHLWQIQAVRDVLVVAAVIGVVMMGYALRAVTIPLLVAFMFAYLCEPLIRHMTERRHRPLTRVQAVLMLLVSMGAVFFLAVALVTPLAVGQTVKLVNSFSNGTIRKQAYNVSQYVPDFAREDFNHLLEILPEGNPVDSSSLDLPSSDSTGSEAITEVDPGSTDEITREDEPHQGAASGLTREEIMTLIDERIRVDAAPPTGDSLLTLAGSGVSTLGHLIAASVEIALLFFLIPFYFFFFSLGYPRILEFGKRLIPVKNRSRTIELIVKMDRVVSGFVRGRIVICFITGILLSIGWWVTNVPYALMLGMLAGAFFLVPYLGAISLPLTLGCVLFHGIGQPHDSAAWWVPATLWPTAVFAVAVVVENYVLTPKIAGKATNLDPVTVIVAVLAGGSLLGMYGMLLAIPLAACAKILFTEVLFPRIDAWIRGERSDPLPIE